MKERDEHTSPVLLSSKLRAFVVKNELTLCLPIPRRLGKRCREINAQLNDTFTASRSFASVISQSGAASKLNVPAKMLLGKLSR